LYTTNDPAQAHARSLEGVHYLPACFQRQPGRFDVVAMLFPFVFIQDHIEWGLPGASFDPEPH
jgi:hypothetical protein